MHLPDGALEFRPCCQIVVSVGMMGPRRQTQKSDGDDSNKAEVSKLHVSHPDT